MRYSAVFLAVAVAAATACAGEVTFTFRQEGTVAGRPYYGVTDFTKQRYVNVSRDFAWSRGDLRWYAYGPAPLGESYQIRRLITAFDIGALPRGTVTKAALTYTIRYDKTIEKADWCKVFSTTTPFLADGEELAAGEIPPGEAGQTRAVTFDVTEYVQNTGASVAFELRSAHDRYMVSVWTSGKWGPWARATDRPFGSPDFFPTLTVTVSAETVPPAPEPRWVGVGERAEFGGAEGAECTFVGKPAGSALSDSDITDNAFAPDAPGEYIVQVVSNGAAQYAAVTARRVRGSHPRLSIDEATLARLKKAADEGDPGWVKHKAAADAFVAKAGVERSYAGFGYRQAVDTLSLAYLVTGDERYVNKAVEAMEVALGDGLPLVSSDSGYCIRAYGPAIAMGYDRLHGFLSGELKTRCWRDLNYWLAWYAAHGYQNSGPAMGNYLSGYFSALYVTAFATYGENPLAPVLMDEAQRFFEDMIVANTTGGVLEGGDDPEGRYAGLYFETWFHYLLTRKVCGDSEVMEGFDWPRQVALAYIHRTRSDEKTFYDYGAWRDQEPSWVSPGPMIVLSRLLEGTREGEYAQYFAKKYGQVDFSPLFDPGREGKYWADEPLSYFSPGPGLATARSSWDKGAYWVSMQGGGKPFCDHQHRDFGHFEFFRGEDELIQDTNTEDGGQGSQFHNCLLVDVPKEVNSYTPGQRGGDMHQVTSFEDTGDAVVMTSNLLPNYSAVKTNEPLLASYRRTHAYIRPNILVIVDAFETAKPEWPAYGRINFTGPPEIKGSIVTAAKGASNVIARFFGDAVTLERVEGEKLLEDSINYRPVDQSGPKTIVMVFAASGADEEPPACAATVSEGKVTVTVAGKEALTLDTGGAPGAGD